MPGCFEFRSASPVEQAVVERDAPLMAAEVEEVRERVDLRGRNVRVGGQFAARPVFAISARLIL
jgi:hypothetical protein